jgi:hypothetical protein
MSRLTVTAGFAALLLVVLLTAEEGKNFIIAIYAFRLIGGDLFSLILR